MSRNSSSLRRGTALTLAAAAPLIAVAAFAGPAAASPTASGPEQTVQDVKGHGHGRGHGSHGRGHGHRGHWQGGWNGLRLPRTGSAF
ncbi:hypothetical protein AB0L57_00840 [Nocardia sp. NPDC052254]|uniref:hypothetical protein n=1 Tax=Nocardia sp. NPDC052254 TaxID=3155681 RepID=UPI0034185EA1